MGKKELYIAVPSFFRCPISLEVMKSPVSLSTGVTYDRINIQRWLDSGNNTCPATMQVLDSKDFVPNHTLHRLIQIWSHNNHSKQQQQQQHKLLSISSTQLQDLISRVSGSSPLSNKTRLESYIKILCFASESPENRKFLVTRDDFVTRLVDIIASEGPDLNPDLLEAILKIMQIIATALDSEQKPKILLQMNINLIPNLAKILKTGTSDSRVAVARILEATATDQESKKSVFTNSDIVPSFLERLSHTSRAEDGEIQAVLSCLISLTSPRHNKLILIKSGCVPILTNLVNNTNHSIVELVIILLEMLVGCTEGRTAITDDPNCIPRIVQMVMKVSRVANEHAVALLWSLCYLFRDQKARELMTKSNGGLTKILLLMQSDCSSNVKRMCCDLLRIFRVNSKSCLASYDTKTTHIMPC